jgi:hypothetical protein
MPLLGPNDDMSFLNLVRIRYALFIERIWQGHQGVVCREGTLLGKGWGLVCVYGRDNDGVRSLYAAKCRSCFPMTYSMRSKPLAAYQYQAYR